jgi:uncharacterized protein YbbC (DUF1343 family)
MTPGELARMFNEEKHIGAELHVVAMEGWSRTEWFDETGLPWVDPSPNIRSLNAALLYPGLGMLEYSPNWSVGRGTDSPFEMVGGEFVDGPKLAAYLDGRSIPGVRAYPVRFQPNASRLAGKTVDGVRFVVTDRDIFNSTRLGTELGAALRKLYPGKIDFALSKTLIGSNAFMQGLAEGGDPVELLKAEPVEKFEEIREKYLLYR